jgi:hypothetical protein
MRRSKVYPQLTKRIFRPELTTCLSCGTRLRRYATLSQRTVITLDGPLRVTHCGYRCPQPACPTPRRAYRSAAADALALPGFTFGLDIVVLVGQLRLAQHHTLDSRPYRKYVSCRMHIGRGLPRQMKCDWNW